MSKKLFAELTDEQAIGVELALEGHDLALEARAGTGKTYTLTKMAEAFGPQRRGLYIAFNADIVKSARSRMPRSVDVRTAHSLAFRAVGRSYSHRLNTRLTGHAAAELLRIYKPVAGVLPEVQGFLIQAFVRNFCQSSDQRLTLRHAPGQELLRAVTRVNERADRKTKQRIATALGKHMLPYARQLWETMIDQSSSVPITHDVYLKLWVMGNPVINVDYILFDEAQDANPVMLDLVEKQRAQHIYVGDPYQQIYSWRGAKNAMQEIQKVKRAYLTQSFRFGEAVAEAANQVLRYQLGVDAGVRGNPNIKSRVEEIASPRAILCRNNTAVMGRLLDAIAQKREASIAGGVKELISMLYSAEKLMAGVPCLGGELAGFQNWNDVQTYADSDIGGDLKPFVKMVNEYGTRYLIPQIERVQHVDPRHADVILSTAHRAKGLEWPTVQLDNDFLDKEHPRWHAEEANLLYVAVTRAENVLDVTECDAAIKALGLERSKKLKNPTPEPTTSTQAVAAARESKRWVAVNMREELIERLTAIAPDEHEFSRIINEILEEKLPELERSASMNMDVANG